MSSIRTMKALSLSLNPYLTLCVRNGATLLIASCRAECSSAQVRSSRGLLLLRTLR